MPGAGGGGGACEELAGMLEAESAGLEGEIARAAGAAGALPVGDIVRLYHRVISTSAVIEALRARCAGHAQRPALADRIRRIGEEAIGDRFDRHVHPAILAHLSDSVRRQAAELRGAGAGSAPGSGAGAGRQRSSAGAGGGGGRFDALREAMSTKEFVEQYGRGLAGHD